MLAAAVSGMANRLRRLASFRPMPGACTTCMAMSSSGFRTAGTVATRARPTTGLHGAKRGVAIVRYVCCAAGRGLTTRISRALPTASGATRSIGAPSSDFGWCVSPIPKRWPLTSGAPAPLRFSAMPRPPHRDRAPMFSGTDHERVDDMAAQPPSCRRDRHGPSSPGCWRPTRRS